MKEFFGAIAVAGVLVMPATAAAQSVGVYVGPPFVDDYYYDDGPPPARYYVSPGRAPSVRSDCGEFHYWNGERCVDARQEPPRIR